MYKKSSIKSQCWQFKASTVYLITEKKSGQRYDSDMMKYILLKPNNYVDGRLGTRGSRNVDTDDGGEKTNSIDSDSGIQLSD